jgi:hypothetical protein
MLDDFHAVKSGEEIGTASNRTVIGEEKSVVVGDVGFEDGAEVGGAGSGVTHQRNFAEANDDLGKEGLIESLPGGSESRSCGRVRVADRLDVRAHLIEEEVHAGLRRNLAVTAKETAFHVHHNKVVGRHHALVEASGGGEDAIGIEADGKIPFPRDDVAAFVQPASYKTNVAAVLFLGARGEIGRRVRRHGADSFLGPLTAPSGTDGDKTAKLGKRVRFTGKKAKKKSSVNAAEL